VYPSSIHRLSAVAERLWFCGCPTVGSMLVEGSAGQPLLPSRPRRGLQPIAPACSAPRHGATPHARRSPPRPTAANV